MLPIVLSAISLTIALTTAWLTLFQRGYLRVTQPVLIAFLHESEANTPKIFFRALLYTTGKVGHVVEGLYLTVELNGVEHNFNYWMYGETGALLIGSGLRVKDDGVSANHHFVPPKGENSFTFSQGDYVLRLYAKVVHSQRLLLLKTIRVSLSEDQAQSLSVKDNAVYFTWDHDKQRYQSRIEERPDTSLPVLSDISRLFLPAAKGED